MNLFLSGKKHYNWLIEPSLLTPEYCPSLGLLTVWCVGMNLLLQVQELRQRNHDFLVEKIQFTILQHVTFA